MVQIKIEVLILCVTSFTAIQKKLYLNIQANNDINS